MQESSLSPPLSPGQCAASRSGIVTCGQTAAETEPRVQAQRKPPASSRGLPKFSADRRPFCPQSPFSGAAFCPGGDTHPHSERTEPNSQWQCRSTKSTCQRHTCCSLCWRKLVVGRVNTPSSNPRSLAYGCTTLPGAPRSEEGWLRLPWEMVGEGRDMAVMPHFSWVHPPPHSRGAEVNLWDLLTCGAQCHLGSLSENRGQRMSTV